MPEDAKSLETEGVYANNNEDYSYQVTVEGLEPETTYAYQLTNGDIVSEIMDFTTGKTGDFSFIFLGDPQVSHKKNDNYDLWDNTLQILDTNEIFADSSFIVSAGDQVDISFEELDYNVYLDHDVLHSIPVATTIGNHDTHCSIYSMHFNIPNESEKYGTNPSGADYYFTYNDVLFMNLNTNNRLVEEHRAFMEESIAANPDAKWKIVIMHHAIFDATLSPRASASRAEIALIQCA